MSGRDCIAIAVHGDGEVDLESWKQKNAGWLVSGDRIVALSSIDEEGLGDLSGLLLISDGLSLCDDWFDAVGTVQSPKYGAYTGRLCAPKFDPACGTTLWLDETPSRIASGVVDWRLEEGVNGVTTQVLPSDLVYVPFDNAAVAVHLLQTASALDRFVLALVDFVRLVKKQQCVYLPAVVAKFDVVI